MNLEPTKIISGTALVAVLFIMLVVLITMIVYSVKKKNFSLLKKIAYALVCEAEEMFSGHGEGERKFSYVANQLLTALPKAVLKFINADDIAAAIEAAVDRMKDVLSTNQPDK